MAYNLGYKYYTYITYWHHPELDALITAPNEQIDIWSFSGNYIYSINLFNTTCTCPDFIKKRSTFPARHPARLCKHLLHYFEALGYKEKSESLILCILYNRPWKKWYRIPVPGFEDIFIGYVELNPWLEIIYKNSKSQYCCIPFNIEQWEWMGFKSPKGMGNIIKTIIKQHFGKPKSIR